jgi:hypothetical protein
MQYAAAPLLRLEWQGSRRLALLLGLAHALSAAALLAVPLPGWSKLLALIGLSVSAFFHVHRALSPAAGAPLFRYWSARRITALELKNGAAHAARTLGGQWHEAKLGAELATPMLAIVRVQLDGRRWPAFVVLMPDMLPSEDFRRLLVRLRWGDLDASHTPTQKPAA